MDLALPRDDQPERRRLHAAGRPSLLFALALQPLGERTGRVHPHQPVADGAAKRRIGERFELGASVTARANLDDNTVNYAYGPTIGFVPVEGMLLTVGYNIEGFRDGDFGPARNTDKGVFAAVRLKFDASNLGFLGLGR